MASFAHARGHRGFANENVRPRGVNRRRSMGVRKKQQEHSFPILEVHEIITCLDEIDIQLTEDDILRPKAQGVKDVFEHVAEICLDKTREQLTQGNLQAITELLEYPELHEESVPLITFFSQMKQLMEASTVDDFSLIDIIKPDPERFINQLSALINFVKFKLDRVKTWNELASRSVQLREECAQLNAEQESLERTIEECKVAKDRDQEEMEAIRVENEELEAEIHSRNKKQSQERSCAEELKKQYKEIHGEVQGVKYQISQANEDCDKLRSRLVNSPDRIRGELSKMEQKVAASKAELEAIRAKTSVARERASNIDGAQRDIVKCIAAMKLAVKDNESLNEVHEGMEDLESTLHEAEGRLQEINVDNGMLHRLVEEAETSLKEAQRSRRMKEAASKQCLEESRKEYEEMIRAHQDTSAEEARLQEMIDEVRASTEAQKREFEADEEALLEMFKKVVAAMESYHVRLAEAGKTSTA